MFVVPAERAPPSANPTVAGSAPPGGGDTLTYTFDPRFVGFEFSASLMLRESQAL